MVFGGEGTVSQRSGVGLNGLVHLLNIHGLTLEQLLNSYVMQGLVTHDGDTGEVDAATRSYGGVKAGKRSSSEVKIVKGSPGEVEALTRSSGEVKAIMGSSGEVNAVARRSIEVRIVTGMNITGE